MKLYIYRLNASVDLGIEKNIKYGGNKEEYLKKYNSLLYQKIKDKSLIDFEINNQNIDIEDKFYISTSREDPNKKQKDELLSLVSIQGFSRQVQDLLL